MLAAVAPFAKLLSPALFQVPHLSLSVRARAFFVFVLRDPKLAYYMRGAVVCRSGGRYCVAYPFHVCHDMGGGN